MALQIDKLNISPIGEWIEYIPSENCKIKNITTETVEYAFEDNPTKTNILKPQEYIPTVVDQAIYFKANKVGASVGIILGAAEAVAIANLSQGIGAEWAIKLDSWGLQKVSQDFRLWRDTFCTGISKKVWNIDTLNGTSYAKQGSGVFSSGTSAGDYYTSFSRKHSRYQPNSGMLYSTAGAIPNATAVGGIRRFGIATIEDGYFFEVSEDGIMYTVVRQSDFQNYTATAGQDIFGFDYDITASSTVYVRVKYAGTVIWEDITSDIATIDTALNQVVMTTPLAVNDEICIVSVNDIKNEISQNMTDNGIDPTTQILYDIQAQWRGAGNVTFTVRSESSIGVSQGFQAVYRNLGQTDRANISNPALSAFVECKNISSAGTDFQLKLGCMNIATEGGQKDTQELESVSNDIKVPITCGNTEDDIFSLIICNPKYYRGRLNTRDIEAVQFSTRADQTFFVTPYLASNVLFLTGGVIFKERDEDSCILYDNNLNADNTVARNDEVDISTMKDIITKGANANATIDISKVSDDIEAVIVPGECMVVIPRKELTSGTTKANTTIIFGERT